MKRGEVSPGPLCRPGCDRPEPQLTRTSRGRLGPVGLLSACPTPVTGCTSARATGKAAFPQTVCALVRPPLEAPAPWNLGLSARQPCKCTAWLTGRFCNSLCPPMSVPTTASYPPCSSQRQPGHIHCRGQPVLRGRSDSVPRCRGAPAPAARHHLSGPLVCWPHLEASCASLNSGPHPPAGPLVVTGHPGPGGRGSELSQPCSSRLH